MRCLIVGTDKLGSAPNILKEKFGATDFVHWSGRKKRQKVSGGIDLIVIYTGFANHILVSKAKDLAEKQNAKTVFVNRGLSELAS